MIVCSPQFGLSPKSNLGGEVYDRELITSLDGRGVETLIILPLGKKYPLLKHAKIYRLPTPIVYPPLLFNLLILPYLIFLQLKYRFKILRVHSPYYVGPAAIVFKLFSPRVKVIASYLHLEPDNKLFDIIDRNIIERFSSVTTISETTKKEIIKRYGIRPDLVTIIPCGVDEKYKSLPKNKSLMAKYNLENKRTLLFLGQLIERKNIPFLFEVIKKLPPSYILMICGDGPLRQELEANAPARVIFTGYVSEADKVDHYNLADVFVYPSRLEGFGLSVLEAMACNRPVIASDIAAFREICSGQSNSQLIPLDSAKWAKAIKTAGKINNYRHVKRNYSWEKSARTYLKLISQ